MAGPLFYQQVVNLAREAGNSGDIQRVLEFMEAIEARSGAKVMIAAQTFRKVRWENHYVAQIDEKVYEQALLRLMHMAMDLEFLIVLEWIVATNLASSAETVRSAWWDKLIALVPVPDITRALKESELQQAFQDLANDFVTIVNIHLRTQPSRTPTPIPTQWESIRQMLIRLSTRLMALFEIALDRALDSMAKRGKDRGKPFLQLYTWWTSLTRKAFTGGWIEEDQKPGKKSNNPGLTAVPLTVNQDVAGRHFYFDAFVPHTARRFEFNDFDRNAKDLPKPAEVNIFELVQYRTTQLHYYLNLFGEFFEDPTAAPAVTKADKDAAAARKAAFAERRALVDRVAKQAKSFDVRTEDGLADFMGAFFDAHVAAHPKAKQPRQDAWEECIEILRLHHHTLAIHSQQNLAESPSYLGRAFPRTLHGAMLWDCGVYAAKGAYILLKFGMHIVHKSQAEPRAAFLFLPIHVGLLVEFDEFPFVVIQNDQVKWLAPDDEKIWRKDWEDGASDDPNPDPNPEADKRRKFMEDYAVQWYARGIDLPLVRVQIAKVSDPPKMSEIASVYDQAGAKGGARIFATDVDKPGTRVFQFDVVNYKKLTDLEIAWFNSDVIPFWNDKAHKLWTRYAPRMKNMQVRRTYAAELERELVPVEKSYGEKVEKLKNQLIDNLRTSGALNTRPDLRVTSAVRLAIKERKIGILGRVREHLLDAVDPTLPTVPPPAFANEDGFLRRIGGW
ncbi:hypothetical protein AB4Y64_14775 [Lysobacter sp. TAF61]|uniref:hypothetical protein n=1 Tax=Lysobacter sp. TAF61 TaxID=3233072 RepID=UPI003F9C79DF